MPLENIANEINTFETAKTAKIFRSLVVRKYTAVY